MNKYLYYHRFLRFAIVGTSNFIISFLIFEGMTFLLSDASLSATISQSFSYSGGTIWSYYWNRKWSFKSTAKIKKEVLSFFLVQFVCLALSSFFIGLFVDYLHFNSYLTWISVMTCITLLNFLLLNTCVFPRIKFSNNPIN